MGACGGENSKLLPCAPTKYLSNSAPSPQYLEFVIQVSLKGKAKICSHLGNEGWVSCICLSSQGSLVLFLYLALLVSRSLP